MREYEFHLPLKYEPADLQRVATIKRDGLDRALYIFIWFGVMFVWFILVAVLSSLFDDTLPVFVISSTCAIGFQQLIQKLVRDRQASQAALEAEKTPGLDVFIGKNGIEFVEGRTTTSYGREDFASVRDCGDMIELKLIGGENVYLPARFFPSLDDYSKCLAYLDTLLREPKTSSALQ